MNRKRILLALALVCFCLGLAGCATTPEMSVESVVKEYKKRYPGPVVKILKTGFDQEIISVKVGEYINFINFDDKPHQIFRSADSKVQSVVIAPYFYRPTESAKRIVWVGYFCSKELAGKILAGKIVEFWSEFFPEKKLKITIIE